MGYVLHDRLGYRLSRVARIIQAELEAVLAPHGLTRLMWLVLAGIGEEGVRSPSAMAAYIGITRPAASRLLARMEAEGFVTRSGADGDGRGVELGLTERGGAVLRAARPLADAVSARFAAKLDPQATAALMAALARLAEGEGAGLSRL